MPVLPISGVGNGKSYDWVEMKKCVKGTDDPTPFLIPTSASAPDKGILKVTQLKWPPVSRF
jgi:hypothetical protein